MTEQFMKTGGTDGRKARPFRTDDRGNIGVNREGGLTSTNLNFKDKFELVDDFKVPHFAGTASADTLLDPSLDNFNETPIYSYLHEKDDRRIKASSNDNYSQHLFAFNILDALKLKGLIPEYWIADDLIKSVKRINYEWVGYGTNGVSLKRRGLTSWVNVTTIDEAEPIRVWRYIWDEFETSIDQDGYFYLLAHSKEKDDSTIYTHYVNIEAYFQSKAERVLLAEDDLNKLTEKIDSLERKIDKTLETDGAKGVINEVPKHAPLRDYRTPNKNREISELAQSRFLHSEKELSNGSLSGWGEPVGNILAETDNNFKEDGETSIKLTASDTPAAIGKSLPTIDFSQDTHIRSWISVDDVDNLSNLRIGFDAPNNTNQFNFNFNQFVRNNGVLGSPNVFTMHKKDASTYGNPDWSKITRMYVAVQAKTGEEVTVWVDNVKMQRGKTRGKVILRLDDGFKSQYDNARPALERHGIPANVFVNPRQIIDGVFVGPFGNKETMTVEDLKHLKTLGWDVSNHVWDHKSYGDRSYQQAYNAMRSAQNWLIDNGFESGARFFTFPNNSQNPDVVEASTDLHVLNHTGFNGMSTLPWGGQILARRPGDNLDFATLKSRVDEVADRKGLLVLVFHRFEQDGSDDFSVLPEVWEEFIEHLAFRNDVDTITYSDLIDGNPIATR